MTNRLAKQALDAEEMDDYQTSFPLWKELASREAQEEYFRHYGWAAFKLEKWQEGQEALERALELDPTSSLLMEMLGHLWASRVDGDREQENRTAKDWLLRALKSDRNARTLTLLGAVYVALEDLPHAAESFEEALRIDAEYEEAMCNLALLRADDKPLEAIKLLERAIEIDSDYAVAHQELGKLHQRQGDVVRAEYHFRRSIDADPADYWSYLYLANALAVQDRDEEAEGFYEFATRLHPDIECGRKFFTNFLEEIGKNEKAVLVRSGQQSSVDEGKP
jgi:tetratricopeptide (TPR) repeat protein